MTDRELMQQALEALNSGVQTRANRIDWIEYDSLLVEQAIASLRERLAQPAQDWDWRHPKAQALIGAKARLEITLRLVEQLVEDPNFETTASDMEYWEPLHDKLQGRLAQPEQEPVGEVLNERGEVDWISFVPPVGTKLYTTPPQRKPLTDEEIEREWQFLHDEEGNPPDHHDFARAIEAAHGIKENT